MNDTPEIKPEIALESAPLSIPVNQLDLVLADLGMYHVPKATIDKMSAIGVNIEEAGIQRTTLGYGVGTLDMLYKMLGIIVAEAERDSKISASRSAQKTQRFAAAATAVGGSISKIITAMGKKEPLTIIQQAPVERTREFRPDDTFDPFTTVEVSK